MRREYIAQCLTVVITILASFDSVGAVPGMMNYQGRIEVDGAEFTGTGYFRFAIVNETGTEQYWSNDGNTPPATNVAVTVTGGLYSLILGEDMETIPASIFSADDLFLRIWFTDGTTGMQRLTPDQRIVSAGFALQAEMANDADKVDGHNYLSIWPTTLANIKLVCSDDFHSIGGTDDDQPDGDSEVPDSITINNGALYTTPGSANVGIGTTSPTARLEVAGTAQIKLNGNPGLEIRSSGGGSAYIDFSDDDVSDYDMRLRLTGDESLTIEGGNLGIGTAYPAAKLDVVGLICGDSLSISGAVMGEGFSAWDTNASNDLTTTTAFSGDVSGVYNSITVIDDSHNHTDSRIADNISIDNGRLYAPSGTGKVGIGTTNPSTKLDVAGIITGTGLTVNGSISGSGFDGWDKNASNDLTVATGFSGDVSGPYDNLIVINDSHTHTDSTISDHISIDNGRLYAPDGSGSVGIGTDNPGSKLSVNGSLSVGSSYAGTAAPVDGMIIEGKVGIGTTTTATGYKLSVDGKIMCEEVMVQNSAAWPDYVFKDDYELITLSELEKCIARNGRLPGLPSAQEVENGGIQLGFMQAKLLEQIEILTLHTIQQSREINVLKDEVCRLKTLNSEMKH